MPNADGTVAWRELYDEAQRRFVDGEHGDIDARRIVEEASGFEGAAFHSGLDELVTERQMAHFDAMVARRLKGEPLQYVVGRWGFRTLDLLVDQRVLIPRPETETLVDVALAEVDQLGAVRAVDLGTGTGAIALSLAVERPGIEVWATDVSEEALLVARGNLAGLGSAGRRVQMSGGSWFDALPDRWRGAVEVLVSNPPYVAPDDELPPEVGEWEPALALVAAPTGFEAIAHLLAHAMPWLAASASVVLEIGETQGDASVEAALDAGFREAKILMDLAQKPRILLARR